MSKGELGSLCSEWAEAVVYSAFTLCSSVNGGHLNRIPAPYRQCLFSVGGHCAALAEWRNPQVTYIYIHVTTQGKFLVEVVKYTFKARSRKPRTCRNGICNWVWKGTAI